MELVSGLLSLANEAGAWALANALPLAVGAMLGGPLFKAGLGLVGDMLGRAHGLVEDVVSAVSKK